MHHHDGLCSFLEAIEHDVIDSHRQPISDLAQLGEGKNFFPLYRRQVMLKIHLYIRKYPAV